ncbi:MAG: transcription termination factor Rho [Patescibacteria group bacterium]
MLNSNIVKNKPATAKVSPRATAKVSPRVTAKVSPRVIPTPPKAAEKIVPTKDVPVVPLSSNGSGNGSGSGNSINTANGNRNDKTIHGVLEIRDGHGVLRSSYSGGEKDAYISNSQIKRFRLREGDVIDGPAREPKDNERYWGLLKINTINQQSIDDFLRQDRKEFQRLTPVYPDERINLEIGEEPLSLRIIDLIAPIGKGQRSLIVSPPKAGKTTLLKDIAIGAATNHPEIHIMAVLVGERPEEVTDIRRHIAEITSDKGEVAASNFDENPESQCAVAELALEKAKRMVERGEDVLILLDSITRLARAYNLSIPTSGRTLSGGFDPMALFPPKKFFGAARNLEIPGSLTIVGTSLVDTGSRMDDLIYEEFKGTGNQEIHLNRRLAERRIYPAIDVQRSGTRRDDLLFDNITYQSIVTLHRMLDMLKDEEERTSTLISRLRRTKSNKEFLVSLKQG